MSDRKLKMRSPCALLIILAMSLKTSAGEPSKSGRQKRFLWITSDGRLALPPGTTMVLNPSLSMPFIRYPLEGFLSNVSISLPFTVDFDKLGLTDNENPYGDPWWYARGDAGRTAGSLVADLLGKYIRGKRSPRSEFISKVPENLQKQFNTIFHGGERAILYTGVEEMLSGMGISGRACMLRAICEVHAYPLKGYGLLGELLKLFLSASKSPFRDLLDEHVKAEEAGSIDGDCWKYFANCEKSLFQGAPNKYSKEAELQHMQQEKEDNNAEEQQLQVIGM